MGTTGISKYWITQQSICLRPVSVCFFGAVEKLSKSGGMRGNAD